MSTIAVGRRRSRRSRLGLNLTEVTISTFLVGLVIVAAMRATGSVVITQGVTDNSQDGATLAQALLAEIMQCHYIEETAPVFGPESDETGTPNLRTLFDDVDDYHGWSSTPPRPKTSTTALAGYEGWTRSVQVAWVEPTAPLTASPTDKGFKRITVTVTDSKGQQTVQTGFRSRWGALQQPMAADTTVYSHIESYLVPKVGKPMYMGTQLNNHVENRVP